MPLALKKVAVLGSNSFIASTFVNYLLEHTDAQVLGISRSPEYDARFLPYAYGKPYPKDRFRFQQIDVTRNTPELVTALDAFRPDAVVNYAAQGEVRNSWKWPEQWWETNCMAVMRLSEALRQRDYLQRYLAVSTPEVYGNTGENTKESHLYSPSTPYAASKLAGDLHLFTLFKHYKFPLVLTRAANLYGIHQQLFRIIPRTVIFRKMGKKLELHGRGLTRRAFIHARDVADGTWKTLTQGRLGEVYHLAPEGELVTMAEVVRFICERMGDRFEDAVTLVDENFGQDGLFSLDAAKARVELGWKPQVSFQKGVSEVIDWISENWDFIQSQPHDYIHKP